MTDLLLDELRPIEQVRNISDYESKSKEDYVKALSESKLKQTLKPKPKQTPETKPKQTPETKPKQEPNLEMKANKKKLKKLRNDFDKSRHKFSNKHEIKEFRKALYDAKKYKLSESEIDKANKNLNKLKKALIKISL